MTNDEFRAIDNKLDQILEKVHIIDKNQAVITERVDNLEERPQYGTKNFLIDLGRIIGIPSVIVGIVLGLQRIFG